jgi:hypothetical protein
MQPLPDNRHHHVNPDRNPDLGLDRVAARAEERLDPQMLLDPFEEQLDLPAALVALGNPESRQRKVVGQEDEAPVQIGIVEPDAPQPLGVLLAGIEAAQADGLIAA